MKTECFATFRFPKARGGLRQRHTGTLNRHCRLHRIYYVVWGCGGDGGSLITPPTALSAA